MKPKRVFDFTMWLDPGEVWKRGPSMPFDIDPTPGSGLWGGLIKGTTDRWTHYLRDWRDECRIERSIEAPPNHGLASTLHLYVHTGTHMDSAFQDDPKGKGLWEIPVEDFCAYAVVLDLSYVRKGGDVDVEAISKAKGVESLEKGDWVLLASNQPAYRGPNILKDAAQWLIDRGIKGIGKGRSIKGERICHKLYHLEDLLIIDSLDDDKMLPAAGKRLWTVSFPLAIKHLEASPCRVVAFEE
jgi:kynurenine formamidase